MTLRTDGQVTIGTRQNLIDGIRAKPMAPDVVDAALAQAISFVEKVVTNYESDVAIGEVGATGTGVASTAAILAPRSPTMLMYGRVQSGKTAGMILSTALCLDNGFRIIIVLTSNNLALVDQTAKRFKDLDGPRVFSTLKDDIYEWEGQEEDIREEIHSEGIVLVCAKDARHLPKVMEFLRQIDANRYPTLILDDEADAATPDTTVQARASGRANAPEYSSLIYRQIIENQKPGEEGESLREIFPHSMYVQVTATPFVLFLQPSDSPIRPTETFLLEPGTGYCGGEVFFGSFSPTSTPPAPYLLSVGNNEMREIIANRTIPDGLAASLDFFIVSAIAKAISDGNWPKEGYKHLSHPSHTMDLHAVVTTHIEKHLRSLRRLLRTGDEAVATRLKPAHDELLKTFPAAASLADIIRALPTALRQVEFNKINSDANVPEYGPRLNFLIGGNILGRGLTIDDLLVTYYVRESKVSQMDTIWQHARMYGYRTSLLPFIRVYLPLQVAARFKGVHQTEEELRLLLRSYVAGEDVPIKVANGTRATRPNAIDRDDLKVFRAGTAQIHPDYLQIDPVGSAKVTQKLQSLNVPLNEAVRANRPTLVPFDDVLALIPMIPLVPADSGHWTNSLVMALMESYRSAYPGGQAVVYVRGLENPQEPPLGGWPRGRIGGEDMMPMRTVSGPVPSLALMYSGTVDDIQGWYPTLVLPPEAPAYIVNPF